MNYKYSDRKEEFETQLYALLASLRTSPGVLIGKKSLTKLFDFISGYGYAFMELNGYRLHFDREFQSFIEEKLQSDDIPYEFRRWDTIICHNKTEEQAFDYFYLLLDEFYADTRYAQHLKTCERK